MRDLCCTYGAWGAYCDLSQAFRPGLTYAPPTALDRAVIFDFFQHIQEKADPSAAARLRDDDRFPFPLITEVMCAFLILDARTRQKNCHVE